MLLPLRGLRIPLHLFKSLRSFAKAESRGLSCMLCPFLPRRPHRLAIPTSTVIEGALCLICVFSLSANRDRGLGRGRDSTLFEVAEPPRIAETDECAHRACFRMAEVSVIHSVTTSATGSTATDIAPELEVDMFQPDGLLLFLIQASLGRRKNPLPYVLIVLKSGILTFISY